MPGTSTSLLSRRGQELFARVASLTFADPRPVGDLVSKLADSLVEYGHSSDRLGDFVDVLLEALTVEGNEFTTRYTHQAQAKCLGLGPYQTMMWQRLDATAGAAVRALLRRHHELAVSDPDFVEGLLGFLLSEPGAELRIEAVGWLARAQKTGWNGERIRNRLGGLLLQSWSVLVAADPKSAEILLGWYMEVAPLEGRFLAGKLTP